RMAVVRMECSMLPPAPTMAASTSSSPAARMASSSVESRHTACDTRSLISSTLRMSSSTTRTCPPFSDRVRATLMPNFPSPITANCFMQPPGASSHENPGFRVMERGPGGPLSHRQSQRQRTDAPRVHEKNQNQLARRGQGGGHAQREPHVGEGGDGLEEQPHEGGSLSDQKERESQGDHHERGDGNGDRLVHYLLGNAPAEDLHVLSSQKHCPHRQHEDAGGGDLDPARGGGGAAADEHPEDHEPQRDVLKRGGIQRAQPRRAQGGRLEHGGEQLFLQVERGQSGVELEEKNEQRPSQQQKGGNGQRQAAVHADPPEAVPAQPQRLGIDED